MLPHSAKRLPSSGIYAWWTAVILYICVRALVYVPIVQNRPQPIFIEDAFTYIWQAVRLDVCLQTCPAMEMLEPTFRVPSEDFKMNTSRVDKISRYLSVYAPLQEGTLLLIQRLTGIEWGAAYWIFIAIGVVLQAAGIGLLLRSLWGKWPAALGLVIAAFTPYDAYGTAHGLIYIVPSNITLTLAMIVWAYIIKDRRQGWRHLLMGVTILVLSHPVGRLYAMCALALYLTAGHWRLTRRELGIVLITLAIIGSYWIFARISTAPPIDLTLPYFNPAFPTYFDLVGHQLVDALHKIGNSLDAVTFFPSPLIDTLFVLLALIVIPNRDQRRKICLFLGLALGMLVAAALTSLPAYPNEGNRRVILVWQIALTGALGTLIVWSVGRLNTLLTKRLRLRNKKHIAEIFLSFFVAIVSVPTLLLIIVNQIVYPAPHVDVLVNFQKFDLNRDDLDTVLRNSEATILYTNQLATLYGLSNGLHRFGAIYPSILDLPPDLTQVDYILGLQEEPYKDPLEELKALYPESVIEETFVLVEGLKSDLRLYVRRP